MLEIGMGGSNGNYSLKKLKNNKQANKIAKRLGYDRAEALKKDFVFNDGVKFNLMIDTNTGEIILVSISDTSIVVPIGLFN